MLEALRPITARRHGVILTSDLRALGLDAAAAHRLTATWYRVARGAYSMDKPASREQWHLMRTVAALASRAPGPVASHISAAVLHGLPIFRADLTLVHLTWDKPPHSPRAGTVMHQAVVERDRVGDVAVTSVARTIIDCARTLPRDTAVVMADFALHTGVVSLSELHAELARMPLRGSARARRVVELADGRAESVGETRTRLICVDGGIPVTPQVVLRDPSGALVARVDLLVDGVLLAIEFDGATKYVRNDDGAVDPEQKHWEEKVRREDVEDLGYVVVNVYWKKLDTPQAVIAKIRRGIARAQRLAA